MRKPGFAYAKTKTQISFAVTATLISAFVFATRIVQFLFFLNPKFQASSHLLWLYNPVCVGPCQRPRRPVFSQRGSINFLFRQSGHDESKACVSNAHVCTSLMKYPDETVFNEGPYCDCIGCHGDWKADDWMAISWPHYERGKLRRSAANSVIAESQFIWSLAILF